MMEAISTGAEVALVVVAYLGLDQVKLLIEQNKYERQHSTLEWLEKYEDFLNEYTKIGKEQEESGYIPIAIEMDEFTFAEAINLQREKREAFSKAHKYYADHQEMLNKETIFANKLEVISTALVQDISEFEIIKNILPLAHCTFVESEAYIFCRQRQEAYMLFQNTVKLYKKFKPLIGTQEQQTERLKRQIDSFSKKDK